MRWISGGNDVKKSGSCSAINACFVTCPPQFCNLPIFSPLQRKYYCCKLDDVGVMYKKQGKLTFWRVMFSIWAVARIESVGCGEKYGQM